eukprot:gene20-395_t
MGMQTDEITDILRKYKQIEDVSAVEPTAFVETTKFNVAIGSIILINAVFIGVETDMGPESCDIGDRLGWYIPEFCFTLIFTVEAGLRLYYLGLRYFKDAFNIMDFVLVIIAIVDTWILTPFTSECGALRMITAMRILRMLKLVPLVRRMSFLKELWLITSGLVESLKTLAWVSVLLMLFLYVCGIFVTMQIGQNSDLYGNYYNLSGGWNHADYFGTVTKSMYTLFQVMTLESWAEGIARHVISQQPMMVIFFIAFLMFTTFGLLNLVIGVIVENTLAAARNNEEKIRKQQDRESARVLNHLRDIFEMADEDGSGTLTIEEFHEALRNPDVVNKLKLIDLPVSDAEELFMVLDHDGSGELSVDEFIGGCVRLKGNAKSKDLLAIKISIEGLAKRLDGLEDKLVESEEKVMNLDSKTQKMARQARTVFVDQIASKQALTSAATKNLTKGRN